MEKVNSASLTLDDIVFENRNRAYGAYDLRTSYERNMTRAVALAPLLLLLLVGTPLVVSNLLKMLFPVELLNPTESQLPFTTNRLTDLDDIQIIPEKRPAALPPAGRTVRHLQFEMVQDNLVNPKDQPATAAMLENAIAGPLTIDGTGDDLPPLEIADGTGEGAGAPMEAVAEPTEFIAVEEMPEFPGGQAAMLKFIGKHLRYPASAQAKGASGLVYVTFVIDPAGQVTKVEVMKGIDVACDAEAVRVVSKMPA